MPSLPVSSISLFCAALAAMALTQGCPGTLDDPSRFAVDGGEGGGCPDIPTAVFAQVCSTSGCHSATDKTQGLDLQSPEVASRVVGACAKGGGVLVDPTQPTQSVLYQKLTIAPPYGSRMPLGKTPLDDATVACVLAWITAQQGTGGSCSDAGGPAEALPEAAAADAGRD